MSHTLAFNRSSASPYCMLRSARVANSKCNVHTAGIPDISQLCVIGSTLWFEFAQACYTKREHTCVLTPKRAAKAKNDIEGKVKANWEGESRIFAIEGPLDAHLVC